MPEIKKKVFLSSTRADLFEYRERARMVFEQIGLDCSSMENEPQSGYREDPSDVSNQWVERADWVVLILGWHFGTVLHGDPRSITQREYDRAVELRKRTFVYFADDLGNADDSYVWDPKEKVNLLTFPRDNVEAVEAFRKKVKEKVGRSFINLADFEKKLGADLRNALSQERIDEETKRQEIIKWLLENTRVMGWIIRSRPTFEEVIAQIRTLHELKEIHDILHHLRQDVIRQLLEVVLPSWVETDPWPTRARIYKKAGEDRSRYIYALQSQITALTRSETLVNRDEIDIDMLETVAACQDFGMVESSDFPDRKALKRDVLEFSKDVQSAFTMMNDAMKIRATSYAMKVNEIRNALAQCRKELNIDAVELEALSKEVDLAVGFGGHLMQVLNLHDEWQILHDEFMRIESQKGMLDEFFSSVDYFVRKRKGKLKLLLDRSNKALREDPSSAESGQIDDPLMSAALLSQLDALPETDTAGEGPDFERNRAEAFFRMRKEFDDEFFSYDVSVLNIVKRARKGARDTLERLFGLQAAAPIE